MRTSIFKMAAAGLLLSIAYLPLSAQELLPNPNWDRDLALQEARQFTDDQQLENWFRDLRQSKTSKVLDAVRAYALSRDQSAPVRELQLFRFTLGLADFPNSNVSPELVDFLSDYKAQTLVAHEENAHSAVPLFNISAAAKGLKHGQERAAGQLQSVQLLATGSELWVQTYVSASDARQRGFVEELQFASAEQLEQLGHSAIDSLEISPDLAPVIGAVALYSKDIAILEEAVCHQTGAYLAPLLREVSARLPESDRIQLLHTAIESAPAANAALAVALLAPGLSNSSKVTKTLLSLLDDEQLGSSAALALAYHPDSDGGTQLQVRADNARIAEWVENSAQSDNTKIALGYPVPLPVNTPLPFDGFRTYAGLQARHQDLAESTPWVHGHAMGTTLGGETIWAYRLGDENLVTRRGSLEHAMLTNGGIHAREWQTPETVTGIMELLATEPDDHFLYSYLRDNANVIVIPVLNIDGFKQTQRFPSQNWMGTDINDPEFSPRDGRMRRKNMLMADENLLTQDDHLNGVDLNRNNAPYWSTNPNRSSPNLKSIVHHGAGPQSERETMALDAAAHLGPAEKLSLYTDVHSFSQVHFWVRNSNNRLAQQTESVLRTFSNHHSRFDARKFYGFNSVSGTPRNQGIGSTDEYFTHTYQVPSWTLEVEPSSNGAGTDYGGLGRNGHDGFILPASQIRRVRTELAKTFAITYYRQSGPPSVTAFRLVDKKTGSTVYESEWDTTGPETRARYEFQTQAIQLDRDYTAWIAFDKPMRWQDETGAAVVLPGQPPVSLDIKTDVMVGDVNLTSTFSNLRWLNEIPEPGFAYQDYIHDALAIELIHTRNANNESVVTGTQKATFQVSANDMTSLRTDADPSTVARWELGAWSGYENNQGQDHTDTGGADKTMEYEITPDNLGDPFVIEAGISSNWRDPERKGEGFVLEILKGNRAVMYWLTYDDFGEQDWYIAVGKIIGNRIEFAELLSVSGGEFGPGFDPSKVKETVVGSANFIWSDCSTGAMEWELHRDGVYRHGRMNLRRLSRLMGIDCGRALLPPEREEAKLMGSWRDITHRGEGYTLELLIDGRAVVYWFTYDTNGNRRWFLGEGKLEDGKFVFPEMVTARGAKFGEAFDSKDVELFVWGSLVMDIDCDGGTATFNPVEEGFPAGVLNVTRLTSLKGLGC